MGQEFSELSKFRESDKSLNERRFRLYLIGTAIIQLPLEKCELKQIKKSLNLEKATLSQPRIPIFGVRKCSQLVDVFIRFFYITFFTNYKLQTLHPSKHSV